MNKSNALELYLSDISSVSDKSSNKKVHGFKNIAYKSDDDDGTDTTVDSTTAFHSNYKLLPTNETDDEEHYQVNSRTNPPSIWKKLRSKLMVQKGNLIAILSAFCLSLGGVFYKKAQSMSGSDNSIFRYVLQIIIMVAILKYKKEPILGPKNQRKLLFLRAFFGIFAVVSTNFAIKYIDPSDNIALSHTNVIITAFFARFILKEKLGVSHILAILVTLLGVILICRPTFIFPKTAHSTANKTVICDLNENDSNNTDTSTLYRLIGVVFAMVGAFGSAGIHIVVKKLCVNKVYFAVTTVYGTFLGLPTSILISLGLILGGSYHKDFKCELKYLPYDIVYGLVGGFFAVLAHVTFNISLQYEDATKVAILRTIDVFFSFILQYLILNISTDYINILGALSILLGTFIILFFKFIKNKLKKPASNS